MKSQMLPFADYATAMCGDVIVGVENGGFLFRSSIFETSSLENYTVPLWKINATGTVSTSLMSAETSGFAYQTLREHKMRMR